MRRLFQASVWHPDAIPPLERKYASPLKRFVFPAFDIIMLVVGVRSMFVGIPSIDVLLPGVVAYGFYIAWTVLAAACLIGAAFPRLWPFEIGGKIALFAVLATYLVALRTAPALYEGARDAVSGLVIAAMLIPSLRLWILGVEERDRRET